MAAGGTLSAFPVLNVVPGNVAASFKAWLTEFKLCVKFKTLDMGNDVTGVGENRVVTPRFTPEAKRLALLSCIGVEGRGILASEGYTDLDLDENPTYERIIEILTLHYGDTESTYVKAHKFVTVRQTAGEDYSSYLLRVETLSRAMGLFEPKEGVDVNAFAKEVRSNFSLVVAVNGLRDQTLCRELVAKSDLTWKSLGNILRAKASADDTVEKLHADVKVETGTSVNAIHNSKSNSSYKRYPRSNDKYKRDKYRHRSGSRNSTDSDYSGRHRENYKRSRRGRDDSKYYNRSRSRSNSRHRMRYCSRSRSGSDRSWSRGRTRFYKRDNVSCSGSGSGGASCYECGSRSHTVRDCPRVKCYRCQKVGHLARECTASRCVSCAGRAHRRGERCPRRGSPPANGGSVERAVKFSDRREKD